MGFFSKLLGIEPAAFNYLNEANPWFSQNDVDPSTVCFNLYDKPDLVSHPGAVVLVGIGDNLSGERVGFVLEIMRGRGVVEGMFLFPYSVATRHKLATLVSKQSGMPLISTLSNMCHD